MSAREWQLLAIQGADHSAGFRERRSLLRGLPGGGPAAGSFKFLSVFKWEERKAWRVLLRACVAPKCTHSTRAGRAPGEQNSCRRRQSTHWCGGLALFWVKSCFLVKSSLFFCPRVLV